MRKLLLTVGFLALAIGLLWIGQGTGAIALAAVELHDQPASMGGLRRHAGAVGLILIWQGNRSPPRVSVAGTSSSMQPGCGRMRLRAMVPTPGASTIRRVV
mgnify:CR=1 FL=1